MLLAFVMCHGVCVCVCVCVCALFGSLQVICVRFNAPLTRRDLPGPWKEGQAQSLLASTFCYIYQSDSCKRCAFHHFSEGCVKMWHCGLQLKLPGHFRPQPCQSCHSHSLMFPRPCAWGPLVSAVPPATWRHWGAS